MRKPRDWAAVYAARNARARAQGFASYGAYRRAVERGLTPARRPDLVRTKRTADAQQVFGWLGGVSIQDARKQMAQAWSDRYARHEAFAFDADRADEDPEYLDLFLGATLYAQERTRHYRRLTPSEDLRRLLVDKLGITSSDDYEDRYGGQFPHGGDYGRWQRAKHHRRPRGVTRRIVR